MRVKRRIVTIGAATTSNLTITVWTSKAGIEHNLLKALTIFPLEITHKRVISLPVREAIFLVSHFHLCKFNHNFVFG